MKPGRSRNFVRINGRNFIPSRFFNLDRSKSTRRILCLIRKIFLLRSREINSYSLFVLYYLEIARIAPACAFTVIISMLCPRYRKFFSEPGWGCVRGDNSLQSYSWEEGENIYATVYIFSNAISSFYISLTISKIFRNDQTPFHSY